MTEGRSTGEKKEVLFDIKTMTDICRLENEYCLVQDRGEVFAKKLGCPMAGFLSPRKTNATPAQSEWNMGGTFI